MELTQRNLGRLFRMPLPELLGRGKQETYKWVDRVRSSTVKPVEIDRGHLDRFLANAETSFFAGAFDSHLIDALQREHVEECQSVLIAAYHASHGRFDLLGYKRLEFGDPIDWHLDPVARRRAPIVHWTRLHPLDANEVGDSKVVWELNRNQWLVSLAQAWQLTRDIRYAHEVVQNIRAWMRQNPVGIGINWASSLEVAFRLIAWSWALLLVRDANVITAEFFREVEASAEAHATHIGKYLSYYFSPNTHLTGEALGLFYAGAVFRHLKHAFQWRSLGARILVQEAERQILADGIYFERSTCYQRYTADIYLHFMILAERAGVEVKPVVRQRLKVLLDAMIALRRPDGTMPDIGDADGGMVLPLSIAAPGDCRSTLSTAAVVFNEPAYAWAAGDVASDTLWLLGARATKAFDAIEKRPPAKTTHVFPVGGFVSMRSGWDRQAHALVLDAGPLGCHFSAGHGHADLLSIQCSVFGEPFLIDAGTGCYTPNREWRDFFRGTAAHNTVVIDGRSQADPAGTFAWQNRCAAQLLQWKVEDRVTFVDALSDAYRRLEHPVTHRRRVAFIDSRYWIVLDDLCGTDEHRVDLRFQFAPMTVAAGEWVRATGDGNRGLLLRAFASAAMDASVRQGQRSPMEGWISSNYGSIEPAPAVVYSANTRLPLRVLTVLWPATDINETPDVEVVRDEKNRLIGIQTASESVTFDEDEVYVRHRRNS